MGEHPPTTKEDKIMEVLIVAVISIVVVRSFKKLRGY
jgi:hypothetical protein